MTLTFAPPLPAIRITQKGELQFDNLRTRSLHRWDKRPRLRNGTSLFGSSVRASQVAFASRASRNARRRKECDFLHNRYPGHRNVARHSYSLRGAARGIEVSRQPFPLALPQIASPPPAKNPPRQTKRRCVRPLQFPLNRVGGRADSRDAAASSSTAGGCCP